MIEAGFSHVNSLLTKQQNRQDEVERGDLRLEFTNHQISMNLSKAISLIDHIRKCASLAGLRLELQSQVYGQHLVQSVVTKHMLAHVQAQQPSKALVLSFHGPTGTGKNLVSRIIAEKMYRYGMQSENLRFVSATKEFPHVHMISSYKDYLRNLIESQISKCSQSMFIIDEVDKMPSQLVDTLKPYLDYHEDLDRVDYRRSIFIFLSNTGGADITNYIFNEWLKGTQREELKLVNMEKILMKVAINSESEGGLWHSELVSNYLVTAFIPFLPLERKDVGNCIRDMMVSKGYYRSRHDVPENTVKEVLAELTFYPAKEQLYSVTGCKRVSEKIDLVMMQ